ncbi:MAG TPA: response regulator transcription factor [Burkholderiales bacterium]|jgi:DNA-binding NarL/FixJ family response regulator|nr:response regulator transcription factor [Burkholderiales bacterium]
MTIRVLIADDHAMMRDGLKALLSADPEFEVIGEVGNGRDTVRRAEELGPDAVILDISMPDLNGIEAARLLRERCPGVRIVMLSMHSSSEHVFRAFEAGASAYLLKDSAGAEMKAALRAACAGRRYLSRAIADLDPSKRALPARASPLERLSARERQVLQLVVEGHSSAEIARLVHLSPKSVETYRARLMRKLGVKDVPALVKFAIEHGLTTSG